MTDADKDFHNSSKPHFSETGVFIYGNKGSKNLESGALVTAQEPLAGATKDIRFARMRTFDDVSARIATHSNVILIMTGYSRNFKRSEAANQGLSC